MATDIAAKPDRPLRPSTRLKAFTTPTVAKIVNKIANGAKINKVSTPGIPILNNKL